MAAASACELANPFSLYLQLLPQPVRRLIDRYHAINAWRCGPTHCFFALVTDLPRPPFLSFCASSLPNGEVVVGVSVESPADGGSHLIFLDRRRPDGSVEQLVLPGAGISLVSSDAGPRFYTTTDSQEKKTFRLWDSNGRLLKEEAISSSCSAAVECMANASRSGHWRRVGSHLLRMCDLTLFPLPLAVLPAGALDWEVVMRQDSSECLLIATDVPNSFSLPTVFMVDLASGRCLRRVAPRPPRGMSGYSAELSSILLMPCVCMFMTYIDSRPHAALYSLADDEAPAPLALLPAATIIHSNSVTGILWLGLLDSGRVLSFDEATGRFNTLLLSRHRASVADWLSLRLRPCADGLLQSPYDWIPLSSKPSKMLRFEPPRRREGMAGVVANSSAHAPLWITDTPAQLYRLQPKLT